MGYCGRKYLQKFDETGFAIGVIATTKVVTSTDRRTRPSLAQPGNREWVTIVEAINASGWILRPMIIFASKTHRTNRFTNNNIPLDWAIAVSDNGWTTDQLCLDWLEDVFELYTKDLTKGIYRLLILDGYSSHLTPTLDQYYTEYKIIPMCKPPGSSHLLQPLDVSCFSILKRSYGRHIEQYI